MDILEKKRNLLKLRDIRFSVFGVKAMKNSILISGSNRGIGLELARQYYEDGWQVYGSCRKPEMAIELSKLTANSAGAVQIIPLDVSDDESLKSASQMLKNEPLDIVFCNAGVYGPTKSEGAALGSIDYEAWEDVFRINTMAPLKLVETFLPNLELGQQKKIALMSSKMGSMADNNSGGSYIYRSTKAALNAVSRSLAIDLSIRGFKVVCLHPGWVKTDMGGPNALITTAESVKGIKNLLDNLQESQNASFLDYQGNKIHW